MTRYIQRMKGQDYIDSTRKYLNYLEKHLDNVAKAFDELSQACEGKELAWVYDDFKWWTVRTDVEHHDLSKFTKEEFVQYRDHFYPVSNKDKENSCFDAAWENHKKENHHHHETCENEYDVVHMVIDWLAMSYKFGDNVRDYYNKTKPSMNLESWMHNYIERMLDCLDEYKAKD